ncbi:hypothetical protein AAF712_016469, partial [Marasmius tenuissimus]
MDDGSFFQTFQLGPTSLHIIVDALYQICAVMEAHGAMIDINNFNSTAVSLNTVSSAIKTLTEEFKSCLYHSEYSPPGYAEFFEVLRRPEELSNLPHTLSDTEYQFLRLRPTTAPNSLMKIEEFSAILRKDFGGDGTQSAILDDCLRKGIFSLDGFGLFLLCHILEQPPIRVQCAYKDLYDPLFELLLTFCSALAQKVEEYKK